MTPATGRLTGKFEMGLAGGGRGWLVGRGVAHVYFILAVNKHTCTNTQHTVAGGGSKGGANGTPPTVKFFLNFMHFLENFGKIIGWRSLPGGLKRDWCWSYYCLNCLCLFLMPPLTENPGSAPGSRSIGEGGGRGKRAMDPLLPFTFGTK